MSPSGIDPLDTRRHDLQPSVMAKMVTDGHAGPSSPPKSVPMTIPRVSAHAACDPEYASPRYSEDEDDRHYKSPPSMMGGVVEDMEMEQEPDSLLGNPEGAMANTGWRWRGLVGKRGEADGDGKVVPRKTSGKAKIGRQSVSEHEESEKGAKRTFSHRLSETLANAGRSVKQTWEGVWRKDSLLLSSNLDGRYARTGSGDRSQDADDEWTPQLSRESLAAHRQQCLQGRFQPIVSVREEGVDMVTREDTSNQREGRHASSLPTVKLPPDTIVRPGRDGYIIEHVKSAPQTEGLRFPPYGAAQSMIDEEFIPLTRQTGARRRRATEVAIDGNRPQMMSAGDFMLRRDAEYLHQVLHRAVTNADRKGSFSDVKRTKSFKSTYADKTTECKQWRASIELREKKERARQKRDKNFLRLTTQRSNPELSSLSWLAKQSGKGAAESSSAEESEPLLPSEEEVQRGRSPPSRGSESSSNGSIGSVHTAEAVEIASYAGSALRKFPSTF